MISTEEAIAKKFHESYERLAPEHGFATRGLVPWEEVPEEDRNFMTAVISELLDNEFIAAGESLLV